MRLFLPTLALLAVVLAFASAPGGEKGKTSPQDVVIRDINEFRAAHHLPVLKLNKTLAVVAQKHAENLAKQDKAGDSGKNPHILDGKNLADRLKTESYAYASALENVHLNSAKMNPGDIVVKSQKNSKIHRENMLNDKITEIGVGVARAKSGNWWFVMVFAKPAG